MFKYLYHTNVLHIDTQPQLLEFHLMIILLLQIENNVPPVTPQHP